MCKSVFLKLMVKAMIFLCVTVSLHSLQQQVSRLVLGWPGPFLQIALHPLLWLPPPHGCPSVLQPPLKPSVLVEKVSEHVGYISFTSPLKSSFDSVLIPGLLGSFFHPDLLQGRWVRQHWCVTSSTSSRELMASSSRWVPRITATK